MSPLAASGAVFLAFVLGVMALSTRYFHTIRVEIVDPPEGVPWLRATYAAGLSEPTLLGGAFLLAAAACGFPFVAARRPARVPKRLLAGLFVSVFLAAIYVPLFHAAPEAAPRGRAYEFEGWVLAHPVDPAATLSGGAKLTVLSAAVLFFLTRSLRAAFAGIGPGG